MKRSRLFFGQRNYFYETHSVNEETQEVTKISEETPEEWRERIKKEIFSIADEDIKALTSRTPKTQEEEEKYKKQVEFIALVFHDRDRDDHGELKNLHSHFILRFSNPRSYDNILTLTKCQERNFQRGVNQGGELRYLTHTTPDAMKHGKTRYEVSELFVIDLNESFEFLEGEAKEIWYRDKIKSGLGRKEIDTKIEDLIMKTAYEISEGDYRPYKAREILQTQLGEQLGQAYYRKERYRFQEDYNDYLIRRKDEIAENGKILLLVYIEGLSEVGKSTFANDLALEINKRHKKDIYRDIYTAAKKQKHSSSWDWISDYQDEFITIFDDISPTMFDYTEFLGTFENDRGAVSIASRYKNKTWFSEYSIFTKSTNIEDFIKSVCYSELRKDNVSEHNNIKYQVKRRINLVIKIESKQIIFSHFVKNGILEEIGKIKFKDLNDFWTGDKRERILKTAVDILERKRKFFEDGKKVSKDKEQKE